MEKQQAKLINGVALAYVGDAIYEVYIRDFLIQSGVLRPNQFHRRATHYVSAKAQAMIYTALVEENRLTEEEIEIFKRGRNAQTKTKAKNTDAQTYSISTGFEAILGFLHLTKQNARIEEIVTFAINVVGEVEKYDPK